MNCSFTKTFFSSREDMRDFIQHYIITYLSLSYLRHDFQFKGGTMLRVCSKINYRFSEDIDLEARRSKIHALVEAVYNAMRDLELPELFTWEIKLDKHDRYYIEMATAHFGSLEILLDVSTIRRNRPQMTHLLDIQPNHPELPIGYPVRCHTDLQVLASKYNCLSSRYKGRDLYDFRYLAEESDNIAKDAWDVYLQTFGKYQTKNNPFLLLKRIKDELVDFEKAWNSDVADSFIDKNESFDETICAIETILRDTIKLPQ